MKVIVQIPAWNEEENLGAVIREIPRRIAGVDCVEVLVIDDGSTDRTVGAAHDAHADYVISLNRNRGLAIAFQKGIDACLRRGADIIVNTDADNQYPGDQIPLLIDQLIERKWDIVIGDRQIKQVEHFSLWKRWLQKIGSWVVRLASGADIPDAPSGFRAYTREAALQLYTTSEFSYTIDNLIQAGRKRMKIGYVPIRINPTRPSRLHTGNWHFVTQQAATIIRTYATYQPLKTFMYLAFPFFFASAILFMYLSYFFIRDGFVLLGHIQSLVVAGVSLVVGFLVMVAGLLADRIGNNRRIMDEILYRLRKLELDRKPDMTD